MLAVLTSNHITITERSALQKGPTTLAPTCPVSLSSYVASVWSPDNASLYVATTDSLARYDPFGTLVKSLWPLPDSEAPIDHNRISGLALKDKGTLILSMGSSVHLIEHSSSTSSSTKIVQTLPTHPDPDPILALSLSHDGTLLTVASKSAVVVHNLALGIQTALRGLPGPVEVCTFHIHSRVRLLLGIGHNLVIYDITRPSGPSRIASIGDGVGGSVIGVACSPYSKTLLAVACREGYIALVDLDKELSIIRSFRYDITVTSLLFSNDGATLYVGTEDGDLLVQTLRSKETPKTIAVGDQGCRVEGLAIAVRTRSPTMTQKMSKLSTEVNSRTTGSLNNKPLTHHDVNSPARSPATKAPYPTSLKKSTSDSPAEASKLPPKSDTLPVRKRVNSATALGNRKIVSSVRSIFANEPIGAPCFAAADPATPAMKANKARVTTTPPSPPPVSTTPTSKPPSRLSVRSKPASQVSPATLSVPGSRVRQRTVSGSTRNTSGPEVKAGNLTTPRVTPRARTTSAPKNLSPQAPRQRAKQATSPVQSTAPRLPTSPPTTSVSSRRMPAAAARGATASGGQVRETVRQRTTSAVSRTSTTRARSPVPPVPRVPSLARSTSTRTPSPELSITSLLRDTAPPFPIKKQDQPRKKGLSVLGLATPEVERWIARKGPEKGDVIKFPIDGGEEDEVEGAGKLGGIRVEEELVEQGNVTEARRLRTLSMQITPRKSAWAASPLRHSIAEGSPGLNGVKGLLHALISDAMLDFRQETRSEIVGLHLDLVRMGQSWRKEMRTAMQEYVGDLKELREENRKLREENERLRRGFF
ncbi:WD40-repeat-containing domain protein [Lactarius pseudohatsudake]|nr:WD40-repeat-containing domain protein [Lactarius pseudohatsudake]